MNFNWYLKDPQLIKDAGSISFHDPLGLPTPFGKPVNTTGVTHHIVPGFMILNYAPVVGDITANAGAAAINIAAKNFYAFIRHANSGSRNYDSPDLMFYILSVCSITEWLSHLMLIYSLLRTYKVENRYYSRAMVTALGYDFEDLLHHLADLRYTINMYVLKTGVFAIPRDISLLERRVALNTTILKDDPVKKSQEYLFQPMGYYVYDPDIYGSGKGGLRVITPYYTNIDPSDDAASVTANYGTAPLWYDSLNDPTPAMKGISYERIIRFTEYLFQQLINEEDIGIMSGDILKAYGSNVFHLSEITEDFHLESIYDDELLSEVHNAMAFSIKPTYGIDTTDASDIAQYNADKWIGAIEMTASSTNSFAANSRFDLVQDSFGIINYVGGSVNHALTLTNRRLAANSEVIDGRLIDMWKDVPSPEEVARAASLQFTSELISQEVALGVWGSIYAVHNQQSELITQVRMFTFDTTGNVLLSVQELGYAESNTLDVSDFVDRAQFHYGPSSFVYANATYEIVGFIEELNNYTFLTGNNLKKLHDAAVISMLSIPLSGLSRR